MKDVYQLTSIGACDESNDDDCCTWETLPEMPGQAVYSHCSLMYDDNLVIMGKQILKLLVYMIFITINKNIIGDANNISGSIKVKHFLFVCY